MAPFSKRQIGYIKAVAGVGQHKSFINYHNYGAYTPLLPTPDPGEDYIYTAYHTQNPQTTLTNFPSLTGSTPAFVQNGKNLGAAVFCLNTCPLTVDHTDSSTDINSNQFQSIKFEKNGLKVNRMYLLNQGAVTESAEAKISNTRHRVGEDFYVESTHIKWRFTMPDFADPATSGKQPHHEYRFIVFRQRHPTLQPGSSPTGDHAQWLNWNYDLFSGYNGRRVGWLGHRHHQEFDGDEQYEGAQPYSQTGEYNNLQVPLTTDDLMTLPVNDADYVVMRDERFFLGAEHGKSHYETVTRFEWTDPGSVAGANLVAGMDDEKNYDWFFLILGTTNDEVMPNLNIFVRGTTAVTSA